MSKTKKIILLVAVLLLIGLWGWISLSFFNKNKDTPSLSEAKIPQKTIDFFNNVSTNFDLKISFNSDLDSNSANKYHSKDFLNINDSCFIIYYSAVDSVEEYNNALIALKIANDAIINLENLMGDYTYPYKVRKRKLPIYLASTDNQYVDIQKQLSFSPSKTSVGIFLYEYSYYETVCKGIVISPEAWNSFSTDRIKSFKTTLWHEMNHYVYFSNFDIVTIGYQHLWFTEGCAEYFADDKSRLNNYRDKDVDNFDLTSTNYTTDSYWAGYTFFKFIENKYGKDKLSKIIEMSYYSKDETAIENILKVNIEDLENDWKIYAKEIN